MKFHLKMRRRTPPQKRISESKSRFNVACWGRQSGKTTYGIDKMTHRPLMGRPNGKYWFVLQTNSAAEVAFNRHWEQLKQSPKLMPKKPNESDRIITYVNGAEVSYKSGEVFENLRMETLDGLIIDEMRQQKKELWTRICRPMLAKRKGWADFLSTANGFDHFYDMFERAKANKTGEWSTFHAPSSEARWWDEAELASVRAELSEPEYAQEILAEFRNIHQGKAYSSQGVHNELVSSPFAPYGELVSPWLPVVVGLDFNVNPMSWHLGQFRGPVSYWFDEIHIGDTQTQECAPELGARLVALRDAGKLGGSPQVKLCGDRTGNSRNTKATESDYAIICAELDRLGISWTDDTPSDNPPVKERVNTMNARLRAADGNVTMFYHPGRCPWLKADLERVSWKEGAQTLLDQSKTAQIGGQTFTLTHASDSVGYPLCVYAPIELYGAVGKLHVISR